MISRLKTNSNAIQEKIDRRNSKLAPFLEELKELKKIKSVIISNIEFEYGPKWNSNPNYLSNKKKQEELKTAEGNILSVKAKMRAIPDEFDKICTINVRTLGKVVFYLIECEEFKNIQILDLKRNVAIDTDVPVLQQRYIIDGKQLRDDQLIGDFINPKYPSDEITIYLVLRLPENSKYCDTMVERHIGERKTILLYEFLDLIKEAENMSMTRNSIINCLLGRNILVTVDNNEAPIKADQVEIHLKYLKYKLKYLNLKKIYNKTE
jgi:hypothetical protein